MSKGRNRSMRFIPQKTNICHKNEYIGENIDKYQSTPPQLSESDVDSITLDLNRLDGLSSSSSLSWSDDYESETTRRVHQELEKVDRVLRGEEPVPSDYDRDEFEQWISFFPGISIFDSIKTPVKSTYSNCKKLTIEDEPSQAEKVNQCFLKHNCDTMERNTRTVINVNESSSNRLLTQRSPGLKTLPLDERKNRNIFIISNKPRSLESERYLKISPLRNHDRKLSSKSMLNRQICEEFPESTLDFNSLPHIELEETNFLNTKLTIQRRKFSRPEIPPRKTSRLILPPISTDQFRSISATPRQAYKTLSALSVKSNFIPLSTRKISNSFLKDT